MTRSEGDDRGRGGPVWHSVVGRGKGKHHVVDQAGIHCRGGDRVRRDRGRTGGVGTRAVRRHLYDVGGRQRGEPQPLPGEGSGVPRRRARAGSAARCGRSRRRHVRVPGDGSVGQDPAVAGRREVPAVHRQRRRDHGGRADGLPARHRHRRRPPAGARPSSCSRTRTPRTRAASTRRGSPASRTSCSAARSWAGPVRQGLDLVDCGPQDRRQRPRLHPVTQQDRQLQGQEDPAHP